MPKRRRRSTLCLALTQVPDIEGFVAPGYEKVRQAFRDNFAFRGELGASVCVYHRGEKVLDLWAGVADKKTRRPWAEDTITTLFSSTKGLAATCLLVAADRGLLDYDAKVADYWPGFARAGKADITVRTLLNHRAGVVGFDQRVTLDDFDLRRQHVVEACEANTPAWRPGASQGYHGVTFGAYVAELFERVTGKTVGRFLADDIAGPLGAEVHIGLPAELEARVATNYPIGTRERLLRVVPKALFSRGHDGRVYRKAFEKGSISQRAFRYPAELGIGGLDNYNTRRVHRMELPWANGLGNARGLAKVYGALSMGGALDGARIVRPRAVDALRERQSWHTMDEVLQKPLGFSQGFIKEETHLFSPNTASFGHPGAGGALGFCDPDAQLGIGYTMNQMTHHVRSPRALALCHALYECL